MKRYWWIFALIAIALLLSWWIPNPGRALDERALANLPWTVESLPGGNSRIFGIVLGEATLDDLKKVQGDDMEIAIVASPGEEGALEAYYSQLMLGFIQAKMIVTVDAPQDLISRMRERAIKAEYMESATRKIRLHPDDLAHARQLPIRALAVIPAANLDETIITERFGVPAERLQVSATRRHLLYPDKGLDVVLDMDGKELLQYVPPRQFSVLREPLLQQVAAIPSK